MLGLLAATTVLTPVPFSTNVFLFAERALVQNVPRSKELLERAMGDVRAKNETFTLLNGSDLTERSVWPPRAGKLGVGTLQRTPIVAMKSGVKSLDEELNETFEYTTVDLHSIQTAADSGVSFYLYEKGAVARASGSLGNMAAPTCSIKLVGDLFQPAVTQKIDDRPIGIYVSPLSVSETTASLKKVGGLTGQIIICAWGHGGDEYPNFISFPNSDMVKHYKIGFDGTKWFANLEKVYR